MFTIHHNGQRIDYKSMIVKDSYQEPMGIQITAENTTTGVTDGIYIPVSAFSALTRMLWLEIEKSRLECVECGVRVWESYMVTRKTWKKAGFKDSVGHIHIKCLEKRLGRELTYDDFKDAEINRAMFHMAEKERKKRGKDLTVLSNDPGVALPGEPLPPGTGKKRIDPKNPEVF